MLLIVGIFIFGIFLGNILWYIKYYSLSSRQSDYSDYRRLKHKGKEFKIPNNVIKEQKWEQNKRGALLHKQIFQLKNKNIKGIILMCHGFGDHSLDFLIEIALKFVEKEYAVITLDAEVYF